MGVGPAALPQNNGEPTHLGAPNATQKILCRSGSRPQIKVGIANFARKVDIASFARKVGIGNLEVWIADFAVESRLS